MPSMTLPACMSACLPPSLPVSLTALPVLVPPGEGVADDVRVGAVP